MPRSPRAVSVWIVLIPGLLLAALAARAVMTEAERAESRSRDRGRAAAARLARSVEGLIDEFEQALPAAGATLDVARTFRETEFLEDRFLITGDGRALEPPRDAVRDPRDAELADQAIVSAERLSAEDAGPATAAALLVGAARALTSPGEIARLLLAAAAFDTGAGDHERALADLSRAIALLPRTSPDDEGALLGAALEAALRLRERGESSEFTWLVDAAELVEADASPLGAEARPERRLAVDRLATPAQAEELAQRRALWDERRELAAGEELPRTRVTGSGGVLRMDVLRRVRITGADRTGDLPATFGGRVPAATVERRLEEEAQALVDEGSVRSVELIDPSGAAVLSFAETGTAPEAAAAGGIREEVLLATPLTDFRVRAVAPQPDAVAPLAVALGLAAALTTVALFGGAVALSRAAARNARLAEDRKRFLDHVAHEVRTPSAALLNLSEELASGQVEAQRLPLYLSHLHREARRLADLVDDTLDLTRLEAGRLTLRREPADLRDLLRAAVDVSAARRTPGIALPAVTTDVPDTPVNGAFDRSAVVRTLRNLIDNAVNHGGGERAVEVRLRAHGDSAVVTVQDHGRGIAAEHLAHVFDRFYRVPSSTHEAKGVGLGLSLCSEIAASHGGSLGVTSTPGQGSTFTLTLPLEGASLA